MANNSVKVYWPPLYNRLTKALAAYNEQSESSVVADAVKDRFDKMTLQEKERILKMAKEIEK